MKFRNRRDAVESAIVKVLRKGGCSVAFISGKDQPDLLCGWRGLNVAIEVKCGNAKLRPGQASWHAAWRGAPVIVLRSVDDAIALLEGRDIETDMHAGCPSPRREHSA